MAGKLAKRLFDCGWGRHWAYAAVLATICFGKIAGAAEPFVVQSIDEFQAIQDNPSGYFVLANDIDASATATWNGGAGFVPLSFSGILDGNGHTIDSLHINRPSESNQGVFGSVSGTVENLRFTNLSVTGADFTGGLAATSSGALRRCGVSGSVTSGNKAAGLVYEMTGGSAAECCSSGTVHGGTGNASSGCGLIWSVAGLSPVSRCFSNADASAKGYGAGLIWTGRFSYSPRGGVAVRDCYAGGSATGPSSGAAGLLLYSQGTDMINCYSSAVVSGDASGSGGFVAVESGGVSSGVESGNCWDTWASGQMTSQAATGYTTDQMKNGQGGDLNFCYPSWDFSAVWRHTAGDYPRLLWENAPAPYVNRAAGQAEADTSPSIVFDVVFKRGPWGTPVDVTGFGYGDVDFSKGTASGITYAVAGSGSAYTITVTGVTGEGTVIPYIPVGVCADNAGVPNVDNVSTNNVVMASAPRAVSITRPSGTCSHTRGLGVDFEVTFDHPVTGVDISDFSAARSTVTFTNAAVLSVSPSSGYSNTYTVRVSTGTGLGTVALDLADDDTITSGLDLPLGGAGLGNGNLAGNGSEYSIDNSVLTVGGVVPLPDDTGLFLNATTWLPADAVHRDGDQLLVAHGGAFTMYWTHDTDAGLDFCQVFSTSVSVQSIRRQNPAVSHAADDAVTFRVLFTDPVTGVDITDFHVVGDGTPQCIVQAVDAQTYDVTVSNMTTRGIVGLDFVDDNTIQDLYGNLLGGPALGDGDYSAGERYAVDQTVYRIGDAIPLPLELGFSRTALLLDQAVSLPKYQTYNSPNGDAYDNWVTNTFFAPHAAPSDLSSADPAGPSGLYLGDSMSANPHPKGYTTIAWKYNDGSPSGATFDQEIRTTTIPAHVAMGVYQTDLSTDGQNVTKAYKVSLAGAPQLFIHHNSRIHPPEDTNTAQPGYENKYLWRDESDPMKSLHAYGNTGLVVLHFEDAANHFLGVQVVDVRLYDANATMAMDIGDALTAQTPVPATYTPASPFAYVTAGKSETDGYIYQHDVTGSTPEGSVFALKANTDPANAEVFWLRYSEGTTPGVMGLHIRWPYEMTRYTFGWPDETTERAKFQLYARGENPVGPGVAIKNTTEFNVDVMPYKSSADGYASFAVTKTPTPDNLFQTNGPGWTLLRYRLGNPPGQSQVFFKVVRSAWHDNATFFPELSTVHDWPVGFEITDARHTPTQPYHAYQQNGTQWKQTPGTPGYVYVASGSGDNRYDWKVYDGNNGVDAVTVDPATTGQILPVNKGKLEVWWYVHDAQGGNDWPSLPASYMAKWPDEIADTSPWPGSGIGQIVIARQDGTGVIPYETWKMYYQNDSTRPGFNPNDEHAVILPYASGNAVFPLRSDLAADTTSRPYVLVGYRAPASSSPWRYKVYGVIAEKTVTAGTEEYTFHDWPQRGLSSTSTAPQDPYEKWAGLLVQPPFPLSASPHCDETTVVSGPAWKDRELNHWAKAAGDTGGTSVIDMRYYYINQDSFYWPTGQSHTAGEHVPWLDTYAGTPGTPVSVKYTVHWPDNIPTMKIGDILVKPRYGLPGMRGHISVRTLYQQSTALDATKSSAKVIDFQRVRPPVSSSTPVVLTPLPSDVATQVKQGVTYFPTLSPALKPRVTYNAVNGHLGFTGFFVEPALGEYYTFLNVMTQADKSELLALSKTASWAPAINQLYNASASLVEIPDDAVDFEPDGLALTTGDATAGGYVTLAFENAVTARPLPVSLQILRVTENWKPGEIAVVPPDCPFDERLVLIHKGDFAGAPADYMFEWRTLPDTSGTPPSDPYANWNAFTMEPASGIGAHSIMISGPGLFTLSDNWFVCRYKQKPTGAKSWPEEWSDWTTPQLAPGWIKRVVGDINPFTQRASGGGIEGAENAFSSFADSTVNTVVSMIGQAGPRWGGDVPLTCQNLNDYGLIQIYETVFGRGTELSINSGYDYAPANNALLLVAGRCADLYMLLGNEAYADAADPTIAYGTNDGTYGSEATSIHCFMNQTSNLLEEELALLRGRDDSQMPPVSTPPVYNRLIWNFTTDMNGGEVAYSLNYNIQDQSGKVDGTIDEYDAKALYPQGHGDAWGHYLSAIKRYYKLLRHPNYTWVPRSEAVMVGGVAVTVDFMDERKFAKAAAARAHAGAEIMGLTYRQYYTEAAAGQWKGYKDTDHDRAWGVSEWGSRAGMGAYLDWVEGNAILPPEDTDPTHTGIKKIDRTTVTDLGEVAAAYNQIEAEILKANTGLNPLGLAKDVTPFDIDPGRIDEGETHFEQVYDRAKTALSNAIAVFDHANNCTQLLRRQSDSLAAFQQTITDTEADFNNRLIESFGYPYAEDIGPTGTYPTGYTGPDLYHYDLVDDDTLRQEITGDTQSFTMRLSESYVAGNGQVRNPAQITESLHTAEDKAHIKTVAFQLSLKNFGIVRPTGWTSRRAPGEIQQSRGDLLQASGAYKKAIKEYDDSIKAIEEQVNLIADKSGFFAAQMSLRGVQLAADTALDVQMLGLKTIASSARRTAWAAEAVAESSAESLPGVTGLIAGVACGTVTDLCSGVRGAIKSACVASEAGSLVAADAAEMSAEAFSVGKAAMDGGFELALYGLDGGEIINEETDKLTALLRQEEIKRLEMFGLQSALEQAQGSYQAALARGERILEDRLRFRQQTAAQIQSYRYKDMAFRIFRNDALQKYQAQFDLAARYVYLTAKAYDYETNLLGTAGMAGEQFLSNVVRCRALGVFDSDGTPQTGGADPGSDPGLANIMAVMKQNFDLVLRGQLGFNNPQTETNRFSLRFGLFRTAKDDTIQTDDVKWRAKLRSLVVDDILSLPEFRQFCSEFNPHQSSEPGIVIKFPTEVTFGKNLFGWPAVGGDSAYSSSHFSTKIRSVGVWFSNYNSMVGTGGLMETPRVYLFPAGEDRMRSPNAGNLVRSWRVLDQKMPVPFAIGSSDLNNPNWIPRVDSFGQEVLADIRKYPDFRAYHDSGNDWPSELQGDSRLIGRSVWNTEWVLVIPAGYLQSDRQKALDIFIDGPGGTGGISDILLFFQTYAYASGNKSAEGTSATILDGNPNESAAPATPQP